MDLVKSIQSTLYERVASPLAGIFLMSWVVMHYDLIMMLMSKNDMFYKTQIIYEYMVIDAKYNWGGWPLINAAPYWYGLFKPLLYSFMALISYSIISPMAFSISSWSTHRLQLTRRKYDKKTPVPAEKLIEIQNKFDKKTDEYRENILRHEVEIDSYKKINQEVNATNIDLKNTIEELTGSLKDIQGRGEQALEDIKEKHHALNLEKEELSVVVMQLKKDNENLADKYENLKNKEQEDSLAQSVGKNNAGKAGMAAGAAIERLKSTKGFNNGFDYSKKIGFDHNNTYGSLLDPKVFGGFQGNERLNSILNNPILNNPVLNHPLMETMEKLKKMGIS